MAYTQDQYTALVDAISQGVTKVKYADKEVEYRSLDDMLRLKKLMETELGLVKGGIKTTLASFTRG
jgi:hypothetical protein